MNDVPLFDDLTPPAERIPITVPTKDELCAELAKISVEAAVWQHFQSGCDAEFVSRVVLVCEQTRAFLGAREP